MRIRGRLLVWAVLAIVPLVVAGLIDLWGTWTDTRRQVNSSMEHQVQLTALALEHWIDLQAQPLTIAANYIAEHPGGAETFRESLSFIAEPRPHWVDLRVVNAGGETILTQPSDAGPLPSGLAHNLLTRLSNGSIAVETDWSRGEAPYVLALAAPINSGGAVIGRLDQTAISNFFSQINSAEQRPIKLLDSQRRLVYRSNSPESYIGTQISNSALFEALGDRRDVVIGEEKSSVDGIQRVYGAAYVGATGYVLTIGVPLDSLYVPARRQLVFHSLLIIVALGCTVFAALLIARDIGQPLRVLARTAFRFGKGDLSARAALGGRDEIAELGATFNTMAASTADREARLKEVDRLKSEFVSSVSHELRTPLTTIKMLTRLMLRGGMSEEEQRECLENMSSECDRQIDLVLNLLDLTRIESGAFNFSLSPVDPVEIVRTCIRTQNQTAKFAGHELFEELPPVLPYVKTDRDVLRRILCSLIENALKYTPGGGRITLGARASGNEVSFYVTDTGVGIPREDMAHIFEKFYRGKSSGICHGDVLSDQSAVAGVGLGLYLAKNLIAQLGGRIHVISEVGRGSTFTVEVPVWVDENDFEFRIEEEEDEKALARN